MVLPEMITGGLPENVVNPMTRLAFDDETGGFVEIDGNMGDGSDDTTPLPVEDEEVGTGVSGWTAYTSSDPQSFDAMLPGDMSATIDALPKINWEADVMQVNDLLASPLSGRSGM